MFQALFKVIVYAVDSFVALGISVLLIGLVVAILLLLAVSYFVFRRGHSRVTVAKTR